VEKMLKDTEYQRSLEFVVVRKNMDRYRSVVDFLFRELHPERKKSCQDFYDDRGPPLRFLVREDEIEPMNRRIVTALLVAKELLEKKIFFSWKWYRETVELVLKAA